MYVCVCEYSIRCTVVVVVVVPWSCCCRVSEFNYELFFFIYLFGLYFRLPVGKPFYYILYGERTKTLEPRRVYVYIFSFLSTEFRIIRTYIIL